MRAWRAALVAAILTFASSNRFAQGEQNQWYALFIGYKLPKDPDRAPAAIRGEARCMGDRTTCLDCTRDGCERDCELTFRRCMRGNHAEFVLAQRAEGSDGYVSDIGPLPDGMEVARDIDLIVGRLETNRYHSLGISWKSDEDRCAFCRSNGEIINQDLSRLCDIIDKGTRFRSIFMAAEEARRKVEEERARRLFKENFQWVTIPGGNFLMGSGNGRVDEEPRHNVAVRTFQMAKSEVTNGQYRACVQVGQCTPRIKDLGWDDGPVFGVDWDQAKTFCERAGGRLPSEAEWEYAARSAGKDWEYPWGDEKATCARAVVKNGGDGCGRDWTWPACSKPAGNTAQGLCDMAGNVFEWTQDWYHRSYAGAPTDGSAWLVPAGSYRVIRGGSWFSDVGEARSAFRDGLVPADRGDGVGFRCARERWD